MSEGEVIECGMGVRLIGVLKQPKALKAYTDYDIVNNQKEIKSEVHY